MHIFPPRTLIMYGTPKSLGKKVFLYLMMYYNTVNKFKVLMKNKKIDIIFDRIHVILIFTT